MINNEYIILQKWSKSNYFYKLKIQERSLLRYTPTSSEDKATDGFVNIFLLNKKIAVYKIKNAWMIYLNKQLFDFEEVKEIKVSEAGIFIKLVIALQDKKIILFEVSLLNALSSTLDPTYDNFDKCTDIFSYWLKDCHARSTDSSIFS